MKKAYVLHIILGLLMISNSHDNMTEYDQPKVDKIIEVFRMTNLFCLNMAEYDTNERQYDKFKEDNIPAICQAVGKLPLDKLVLQY
jgi:hypothetical protein